jgi:hypothetical protein
MGSDGALEMTSLPLGAIEVGFTKDNSALTFFVPNSNGGTGYTYSLDTKKTTELFTIPLRDVRVLWGTSTYVYTTPSAYAMGYVYRVGKSGLEYVTEGGKGLMAYRHASGTIVTTVTSQGLITNDVVQGPVPLLTMFTEKCAPHAPTVSVFYCASPRALGRGSYPDDWYKGTAQFSDYIFAIGTDKPQTQLVSNLEEESGRPVDIMSIGMNTTGTMLYFINKYDNVLWVLDLSRSPASRGNEAVFE